MLAFRGLLFSAAAGTALLTNVNANAGTPVSITYVPKSLAEAIVINPQQRQADGQAVRACRSPEPSVAWNCPGSKTTRLVSGMAGERLRAVMRGEDSAILPPFAIPTVSAAARCKLTATLKEPGSVEWLVAQSEGSGGRCR